MSKKTYTSKYTDNKVTDAQYLCDEIMERIARKNGEILPYKYWALPRWKKDFLHQVTAAGKLLQESDIISVMAFLRSPKGRNIFSLGLRKQILEGAKQYIVVRSGDCKEIKGLECTDIIIDDFIEDEIIIDEVKPKTSWELLS